MYQQDAIEKYELLRDIAEHNAAFQNSEGVKQVRDARENSIVIPDDAFREQVKEMFGRDIDFETGEEQGEVLETVSTTSHVDFYDVFDEVEFVPFGE